MTTTMTMKLEPFLDDLQRRIDEKQEEQVRSAWRNFLDGKITTGHFAPPARKVSAPGLAWPKININDAVEDCDLMVLRELAGVSNTLSNGFGSILNVRCNYGTGILPMLFGAELFMMDRALDTLPTARPFGSTEKVKELVARGVPVLTASLGGKVFRCAERFQEILRKYPALARNIALYHPDLQGPIDVAEVLWGSEIFLSVYDEPELLRRFLKLITGTYIAFMEKWLALAPQKTNYNAHWGLLHKGHIVLRNDSLVNLSPDVYVDMVRPCDQAIFDRFGGGVVHFCGKGDHFIAAMSEMRGLTAINTSQPHLNDMATIFRHTIDKGILLLALQPEAVDNAGRPLLGRVQRHTPGA